MFSFRSCHRHALPFTEILRLQKEEERQQRHRKELEDLRKERQRLISQQKQQRAEKTASSIPDLDLKRIISSKVMTFPHNPHTTRRVTAYQSAGPPRRRHFPARAQKVQHHTSERKLSCHRRFFSSRAHPSH